MTWKLFSVWLGSVLLINVNVSLPLPAVNVPKPVPAKIVKEFLNSKS